MLGQMLYLGGNGDMNMTLKQALEAVRQHLGMDAAYLTQFSNGVATMREVAAPGLETVIKQGKSTAFENTYYPHILSGRLPELMSDIAAFPLASTLPITRGLKIGSHISVRVVLPDGSLYGMFTCMSRQPNLTLNVRDLSVMHFFSNLLAMQINREQATQLASEHILSRIRSLIADELYSIVYQPICCFQSPKPIGFEALCRFAVQPYRSPDLWFKDAALVGLGVDLELAVLRKAVTGLKSLPDDVYVSVNASPATILSGRLPEAFAGVNLDRIVLELTEHAPVTDYAEMRRMVEPLQLAGIRIAIDDAGAGYASMQHIIQLSPDIIKLDLGLTRGIDADAARRALTAALIFFARETGCTIVAEGIETQSELDVLRILGVTRGQGYLLGRPADLATAIALTRVGLDRLTA